MQNQILECYNFCPL